MKIYDVSLPITDSMLVWGDDEKVSIQTVATVEKDGVRLSKFSFGSHTGTHIDAPNHFLRDREGVDKISLEKLIGRCMVIDLTKIKGLEILPSHLDKVDIKKGDRVVFKTGNFLLLKKSTFPKSYVSLSESGASFLVERGVCLVGTDFLGIEKRGNLGHPVHKMLLSNGIVIVEGLDLSEVEEGIYDIICLPLRVVGADGSPARVMLIKR